MGVFLNLFTGSNRGVPVSAANPLPVTGTFAPSTPYCNTAVGAAKYQVGAGGRVLTDYFIENPDDTDKAYLQLFDAESVGDVILGTTEPKWSIGLDAGEKANLSGLALAFPLGLVIAATATVDGSGAPATSMVVNLGHR